MTKLKFEDIKFQKKIVSNENRILINNKSFENSKININLPKHNEQPIDQKDFLNKKRHNDNNRKYYLKLILILIIILFILYLLTYIFDQGSITIKAKSENIKIENMLIKSSRQTDSVVNFEIMTIEDSGSFNLKLVNNEEVSIKSSGTVEFYNEYSVLPVKIQAGEFLSDELGKSYKVNESISIPGYKVDIEGNIISGKKSIEVESFLPGSVYNGLPNILTVNSLKNTDKSKKIYARPITEFKGGALGQIYKINENDKEIISKYSEDTLKNYLIEKAKAEIPDNYMFYPRSVSFTYTYDYDKLYTEQNAEIIVMGKLTLPIFRYDDLSQFFTNEIFDDMNLEERNQIKISNIDNLIFNYKVDDMSIDKSTDNLEFILNGQIISEWKPNLDILIKNIIGRKKNEVIYVLSTEKSIEYYRIKLFPPWKNKFPRNIDKIHFNIEE